MKRNYWPLFFIGIFSFVFSMIIWTIVSATSVPVQEDYSFMKKYQDVDDHYNEIILANDSFLKKYDFYFFVNKKRVELTTQDIKYSQRVLEKISKHKDLLVVGDNELEISIINKDTKQNEAIEIMLVITKSSTNDEDIVLNNTTFTNENNVYKTKFNISQENNWNITGNIKTASEVGSLFIKTNAK